MGYYQGDWYAGARGDPGFFSSLFSLAGGIPVVGPALSKIGGALAKRSLPAIAGGGAAATAGRIIQAGKGVIMRHPAISAAAGAGVAGAAIGGGAARLLGRHRGVIAGMRKRKRMNVCNPRALRRAIRRTHGFAKLAMRTIHLVHPKKKARFGGFRKKKAK